MFDFIETGRGIQILYEYTKEEILESDFFELPPEGYKKLLESEQEQKWYMLNPAKLNKNYITEKSAFVVDDREKDILLRAVKFINTTSATLPTEASFLEKLLYTKKFVPSCFFSGKGQEKSEDASIIPLNQNL